MLDNKKGADKILSIYWFVILIIVAGGIFAMVYNFYGSPYDVRGLEANALTNKVADCISRGGMMNSNLFSSIGVFNENISDTFLEKCGITFNTEDEYNWKSTPQYFFEVQFYKLSDTNNAVFSFNEGNINWKPDCNIKKSNSKDYEKNIKCAERRLYAVDSDNNQYLIQILSGVGKLEKNVKQ